jgi:hypothetical protein
MWIRQKNSRQFRLCHIKNLKTLDKHSRVCYTNIVKGRGNPKGSAKPAGEVLKKSKKPLDKPNHL